MDSHFQLSQLTNGLTLLTVPMPAVESVTAIVLVRVGSRFEKQRERGLSHFLEHMVFKGTQKYPTALALSSVVDSVGAEFNAFTGKEYTGFWLKASAGHLPLALEVLSQLVFYPLLESQELEKEKGVIIEEINMYEDQPMAKVENDFETLLYGDTPLGWETIGTKETVKSFQRKDFLVYLRRWYQPQNMVLTLAGASSALKKAKKEVLAYFKAQKSRGEDFNRPNFKTPNLQQKPAFFLHQKKTEQAHLCLGVRTFKRTDPRRYALAVLATLLGGNMSSRLFTEVREKRGLAYYVRTWPQAYEDQGYLVTQAGTAIDKSKQTIEVILTEYQKLIKEKVKSQELKRAKEYLKGKLILALEDSRQVAELYAEDCLLEAKVRTPKEIFEKIDEVTSQEIKILAENIFQPKNLNLALIGPYKNRDRQQFEKIIQ